MSGELNNITAPDEYTPEATLSCPQTARVRIVVSNQAIYWQRGFQSPGGGGVEWPPREEFLPPTQASFDESCDAIRIRAAVPAAEIPVGSKQAQVTIGTRTAAELPAGS